MGRALRCARQWLAEQVTRATREGRGRLPTVRAMAAECGVSANTMLAAVAEMRNRGLLHAVPGAGIRVAPTPTAPGSAPDSGVAQPARKSTARRRWAEIGDDLARLIRGGRFGPDVLLPSRKELCSRYGAGYATVSRALRSLSDARLVVPAGIGYRVAALSSPQPAATIVVIARNDDLSILTTLSPTMGPLLQGLEDESRRLGFRRHMLSADWLLQPYGDREERRTTVREIETQHAVIGYLIIDTTLRRAELFAVLAMLSQSSAPVAVLHDTPSEEYDEQLHRAGVTVWSLATDSAVAGRRMGACLAQSGHRELAFLSAYSHQHWSQHRLEGLRQAVGEEHVRPFVLDSDCAAAAAPGDYSFRPVGETGRLLKRLGVEPTALRDQSLLSGTIDVTRKTARYTRLRYVQPLAGRLLLGVLLQPLFEAALQCSDITAWVCANDLVAVLALDFLTKHDVAVPRDISVVGYDNSTESFVRGITSYDFDMRAALSGVVRYLLEGSGARRCGASGWNMVGGDVVVRETSMSLSSP